MKKSTRMMAILMAMVMLFSSFAVLGSAFENYKGDAIKNSYNDVDAPELTLEQYASMALDEVDRMLAEEEIVVDIYIGTLDLGSVSGAIASIEELLTSVSTLLPLLGDAQDLTIASLEGKMRECDKDKDGKAGTTKDLDIIKGLLNFLADNAPIFEKYANGTLSVGILQSLISSYVFNVRELVIGLVYGMLPAGKAADYDYMDMGADGIPDEYMNPTNGVATLLQDLLNSLVLGEWTRLDVTKAEAIAANPEYTGDFGLYLEDPLDNRDYEDYKFEGEYDPVKYDYYGWVHPKQWVTIAFGGSKRVTAGAPAPAPIYTNIDIKAGTIAYDFIENLLQVAYNDILVPVLNEQTRPALRKWCGIEYDERYTRKTVYDEELQKWVWNEEYDPNYDGNDENYTPTALDAIFNVNARAVPVTIPEGSTFIEEFNTTLGDFCNMLLKVPAGEKTANGYTWNWIEGGNEVLFQNIVSVARFVLQETGTLLFADYVKVPTAAELDAYTDQQVVAFIMRAILNASVDWLYVDETNQTIVDVGYAAVEQLAYQDIPEFTYTKPVRANFATDVAYYDAVVDKALDILFDVAVYNLNQGMDMVPTVKGTDPASKTANGLIPYQGDTGSYEATLIQIAAWAFKNYAPVLALNLNCYNETGSTAGLDIDDVWNDLDTIINAIIPIKGGANATPWISAEIAGNGTTIVSKPFIFDYILKPIYTLNATNFAKIFDRNPNGAFATMNGINVIVDLLDNVFDLLFPNVFDNNVKTIDAILDNQVLGTMVHDLIKTLGTESFQGKTNGVAIQGRANNLCAVALPLVTMLLGLSDDQEFEEIEIFLPETIAAGEKPTFRVYNSSSGINTAYRLAGQKTHTQDALYVYTITQAYAKAYKGTTESSPLLTGIAAGTKISAGDSVNVTLNADLTEGTLVEVNIEYTVSGETGKNITATPLKSTVYGYVGATDKSDDEITIELPVGDRTIEYESEIYVGTNRGLGAIENYGIRIRDSKENEKVENPAKTGEATLVSVTNANTQYPFATKNTDAKAVEFYGQGGIGTINPFLVAQTGVDEETGDPTYFERFEYTYAVDEEGKIIIDEKTEKPVINGNNGGVPDGKYTLTTALNIAGTTQNITTNVHLYNDFGLGGLFDSCISANRQQGNYNYDAEGGIAADYWADYVVALKDAAVLCMRPKNGSTFEASIKATKAGYENLYEQYYDALSTAIENLDKYEKGASIQNLIDALKEKSGYDYVNKTATYDGVTYNYRVPVEYDETGYKFFGMTDFVPHTYTRYRDPRGDVHSLIEQGMFFGPIPLTDTDYYGEDYVPTQEEIDNYNAQAQAHIEALAERNNAVNAVEAAYALHMLELTYGRLIRKTANVSKLEWAIDMCITNGNVNAGGASFYTAQSWEDYTRAKAFAEKVIKLKGNSALEPSRVNTAMSNLVESWKKLVQGIDFTALDAALEAHKSNFDLGLEQTVYTAESYQKFYDAYLACKNVNRDMGKTKENEAEVARLVAELNAVVLEANAAATEPTWEINDVDNGYFYSYSYEFTSVPYVDEDIATWYAPDEILDTGAYADGYILGVGTEMWDGGLYEQEIFINPNNAEVYVTGTDAGYGTGTVVQILDATTGEVIKSYVVVLRGDVTGDSFCDTSDLTAILEHMNMQVDDWVYTANGWNAAAADLDADWDISTSDYMAFNDIADGQADIDQGTGEVVNFY